MIYRFVAGAALAACAFAPLPAAAQYYQGKTLTMLINYGAGGNTDTEGRVFLRHLSKHLAGNPNIIVSNRPGAGGLVGINYLGSGAVKPDGLTFCFCTLNIVAPIIGDPALKVKYDDFAFIAGVNQWNVAYGRKDIKPGLTKPADFAKAVDVFGAGYNPSTPHDMRQKLSMELMGAKFKMVTGFQSIGDINKAIAQNEVNFTHSSMPAYMGQVIPNLMKTGITIPLWYYAINSRDGKPIKRSAELDALKVPLFSEVYREAHGKAPSGVKWEGLMLINNLATTMLRAVLLPKGTPDAAVAELRKAFAALATDKEFQAEYQRVIKVPAELVSAEDGQEILAVLKNVKPEVAAALKEVAGVK